MPTLVKSIPTYRKHRASGQAVVSLNGRDFYLGPHGTRASKLEYDRLIGEWLQQLFAGYSYTPRDEIWEALRS